MFGFPMNWRFLRLVTGLICSHVCAAPVPVLKGRVLDPARVPIAGVQIRIVPSKATEVRSALSSSTGEFSLDLPLSESYTLIIAADGFSEYKVTVTSVEITSAIRDIVMQMSPVRSTITVMEGSGYVNTATSTATRTLT